MNKILFIIGISFALCSCKKHNVEPAPSVNSKFDSTEINYLPQKVTYYSGNRQYSKDMYEFTYYPNNLVKTIRGDKSTLYIDSTVFLYNTANQVVSKINYRDNVLYNSTYIIYSPNGKIDSVNSITGSSSQQFKYHYSSSGDMSYVLDYNNGGAAQDSIIIQNNKALYYANISLDPTDRTETPNGFALWTSGSCYNSSSGIFDYPATSLNIPVNLQLEVAETFLDLGATEYPNRNFYTIPLPRKYCESVNNKTYTYTFDNFNRLIKVTGIFPSYAQSGSPIPGEFDYEVFY